ncbi:MAG: preprotein translocase subunit SecA, partial [Anaerolineae bacterium]
MLKGILGKVVGGSNDREIRKLQPLVDAINALEPKMEERTDAQLRAMTDQFRRRLAAGEPVDDLLVEAFAVVREVAKRTVDMRPFDVQLIGGIVLHRGAVAEMKTGEGKTLVATMPIYLNALLNRGAHLVTVNDYLARRDSLWMGAVYHQLGLSIGLLQSGAEQPAYLYDPAYQRDPYPGLRPVPRKEAYAAHITYGTNNEFGFDYLRDNVALSLERRVQRPLSYAIVDEVDNIFIDEARTPLIISGPSGESVEDYSRFASIARKLQPEVHYELDDKERSVYLTDEGLAIVEEETGIENIYDEAN